MVHNRNGSYFASRDKLIPWDICPCCKIGGGYYVEYCPVPEHQRLALIEKDKGIVRRK